MRRPPNCRSSGNVAVCLPLVLRREHTQGGELLGLVWVAKDEAQGGSEKHRRESPLWLSWLRTRVVSMRMWVRSLGSLSRLRIQCRHGFGCGVGWQLCSDSTPSLGTSMCRRCGKRKKTGTPAAAGLEIVSLTYNSRAIGWVCYWSGEPPISLTPVLLGL